MWFIFTITAYLLLGFGALIDRYILTSPLPNPKAYTFLVGVMGVLSFALVPFGFEIPSLFEAGLNLLSGVTWMGALFLLYQALSKREASRSIPAIGALVSLFSLFFSIIILGQPEKVSPGYLGSFLLLGGGTLLLSWSKNMGQTLKVFIGPGVLFGLSFILAKAAYLTQPFISSFVWMRIGGLLFVIPLLFSKDLRSSLKKRGVKKGAPLAVLSQVLGGGGFLLQSYAIYLSPPPMVPIINGLEGVRYVFIFTAAFLLSKLKPSFLKESFSKKELVKKAAGIILVGAGTLFLSLLK